MGERIPAVAMALTTPLADAVSRAIFGCRTRPYPERLGEIHSAFEVFRDEVRDYFKRLWVPLIENSTSSLDHEAVWASVTLLIDAQQSAVERGRVWDRRLARRTVFARVRQTMWDHIAGWSHDRGMDPDVIERLWKDAHEYARRTMERGAE